MRQIRFMHFAVSCLLAMLARPACAGDDARMGKTLPFFSEIRLGGFLHDPQSPEAGGVDPHVTVFLQKPDFIGARMWNWAMPRAFSGVSLNLSGKTSHLHGGLAWDFDLTSRVFVAVSFGGALHSGSTARITPENRNAMGCPVSFRESAALGVRLTTNWSVLASVEHLSNAGLCRENRGLTNMGFEVGYRF